MGFFGGALKGFSENYKKRPKTKKLPLTPPNASNTTQLSPMAEPESFKKGGRVKKGGWAKVHAGEKVIPAKRKRGRRAGKRR